MKFCIVSISLALMSTNAMAYSASLIGKPNTTPKLAYSFIQKKKCTLAQCQKNYCDRVHPGSTTCAAKCVELGNC